MFYCLRFEKIDKIGGKFALASPTPNCGVTRPPCPPVIYAHDCEQKWALTAINLKQSTKLITLETADVPW